MRRKARRLVERLPAAKIGLDDFGEFAERGLDADMMHEAHHVRDTDERHQRFFRWKGRRHRRIPLALVGWRRIAAAHVGRYIRFVRFGGERRFSPDDLGRSHAKKRRTACAPLASSQMGRTSSYQAVSALVLAPVSALVLAMASSAATSLPRMKARRI